MNEDGGAEINWSKMGIDERAALIKQEAVLGFSGRSPWQHRLFLMVLQVFKLVAVRNTKKSADQSPGVELSEGRIRRLWVPRWIVNKAPLLC